MQIDKVSYNYYVKFLASVYGQKFINAVSLFGQETKSLNNPLHTKPNYTYNVYIRLLDTNICFASGYVYKFSEYTEEFLYLPSVEVLPKQGLIVACEQATKDEVVIGVTEVTESSELLQGLINDINSVEESAILTKLKKVNEKILLKEHLQSGDYDLPDEQ